MKISTKGRYALRMLTELAVRQNEGFISLKEIAARQDISKKYLEQIVPLFYQSGILTASRGAQGGYRLAKDPSAYTVGEILRITEGSLEPVDCVADASLCPRAGICSTRFVWEGLHRVVTEYLDSITLQDLADRATQQNDFSYVI